MPKFNVGDIVYVKQCTTPGSQQFGLWVQVKIKNQSPLTVVEPRYEEDEMLNFEGVGWVLYPRDVELFDFTLENE